MNQARHLWDIQWFRDLVLILVVLVLLLLAYSLRGILLPIVMALALAYAFHPLISWLHAKARIPRWLSTTGLLAITTAVVLSILLWLTPQLVSQTRSLYARLPGYTKYATLQFEKLQEWAAERGNDDDATSQPASQPDSQPASQPVSQPANQAGNQAADQPVAKLSAAAQPAHPDHPDQAVSSDTANPKQPPSFMWRLEGEVAQELSFHSLHAAASQPATSQPAASQPAHSKTAWAKALSEMDFTTVGSMLVQTFNYGLGVVGVTLSLGMYLALVMALLTLGFFFFSWKFDRIIHWFDSFIPNSKRPRILHILGRMDKAISAFVRGRLLQVSIIMCVLCVGWAWVGVPYWLLLGVLGGMLNIVPYAAVVSWPIAVLLMWIDTASGSSGATFTLTQVFIWPSVVYIAAQSLDGWVVEPLVQGKATNLDPFSVLVAVIIGGSLLGILGTIIAVPTAACLKIFLEEVVLPHVRKRIHERDTQAIAHTSKTATAANPSTGQASDQSPSG